MNQDERLKRLNHLMSCHRCNVDCIRQVVGRYTRALRIWRCLRLTAFALLFTSLGWALGSLIDRIGVAR